MTFLLILGFLVGTADARVTSSSVRSFSSSRKVTVSHPIANAPSHNTVIVQNYTTSHVYVNPSMARVRVVPSYSGLFFSDMGTTSSLIWFGAGVIALVVLLGFLAL